MFDFEFAKCKNLKIIKTCNFYELLVKKKKDFQNLKLNLSFFSVMVLGPELPEDLKGENVALNYT